MPKKKIIYITPHLSTGGLPQYLYRKIELLKNDLEIFCIEYRNFSDQYTVQKNKIKDILDKNHFFSLGENKEEILSLIEKIRPDYIHMEELPEYFCDKKISMGIYRSNRPYKIFETSHDSKYDANKKMFFPDKFIFISQHQKQNFGILNIPSEIVEYPIEYKLPNKEECLMKLGLNSSWKHVINVGLFTPGKNQLEIFEYAKLLRNEKIKFHFIGNQASNFKDYWEPIMEMKLSNTIVWGERSDVDNFYQIADLFLFTSKNETSPLVIRESISWNLPILMYDLPTYLGMYDQYDNITYLTHNMENNKNLILEKLNIRNLAPKFFQL